MQRIKSLVTALDVLGVAALCAAALALVDASGLATVVPVVEALSLFTSAFAVAVGAFTLAGAQIEVLAQEEATAPVPNPFQRAA